MYEALINNDELVLSSPEYNRMMFLALAEEIEERLDKDNGWKYVPMPKQKKLHKSNAKIRQMIGGNRIGKTKWGTMEVRWSALDEHPWLDTAWIKTIWIVGLDRTNMLNGTLIPAILEAIPERYIEKWDKREYMLYLTNGKIIVFKSCDSQVDKFQSKQVDLIWFDEEPPYDIYKECLARLIDTSGKMMFTMTPTNGMSWTYDEIYSKAGNGIIDMVKGNMRENIYLPESEIDIFEASLTPQERLMRLNGDYVVLGGRKIFDLSMLTKWMLSNTREPLFSGDIYQGSVIDDERGFFRIYEKFDAEDVNKPSNRGMYYIGVDTSEGVEDNTAVAVMRSYGSMLKLIAVYNRTIQLELIYKILIDIGLLFPDNLLVVERNMGGSSALTKIKYDYTGTIYMQEDESNLGSKITRKLGWHTSDTSKKKMIRDARDMFQFLDIPDKETIKQFQNYIEDSKGRCRAQTGRDDIVMAIMLAIEGYLSMQGNYKTRTDAPTNVRPHSGKLVGRAAFHNA